LNSGPSVYKQVIYFFSHIPSSFFVGYLWDRVFTPWLAWPWFSCLCFPT
jgi:hypothetical protein